MRSLKTLALLATFLTPCFGHADAVLYHGFQRVDTAARAVVPDAWMIVENGRILGIGSGVIPEGMAVERRDMTGTWAIPGLIDGHAHITAGPHRVEVVDGNPTMTIESDDTITRFNALMALAFGVTTVRNPGGDPEANARYDAHIASDEWSGPTVRHAGAVIQPPPFGGNAFAYPETRETMFAEAKRQADLGMTYFKLYTSLTPDELALGIEAAHAHGLEAIAHLDRVSWQTALELDIDGLEHALPTSADLLPAEHRESFEKRRLHGSQYLAEWFSLVDLDGQEMQRLLKTLQERQTTLNLTLLVNEMVAHADDLSVIIDEASTSYFHPESWGAAARFLSMGAATWTPEDFSRARAARVKVLEFARRLFEAGIPLLIGTDGNGGGPLMAAEMHLHVEAGLDPYDVLDLATDSAARVMGLTSTGRLAPGFEADVAFLSTNPVVDVRAVRDVTAILVDGSFRRHEDLVAEARALLE